MPFVGDRVKLFSGEENDKVQPPFRPQRLPKPIITTGATSKVCSNDATPVKARTGSPGISTGDSTPPKNQDVPLKSSETQERTGTAGVSANDPKSSTKPEIHLKPVEGRTGTAKILATDTTLPKKPDVPLKTVEGRRGNAGPSSKISTNVPTPPRKQEVPLRSIETQGRAGIGGVTVEGRRGTDEPSSKISANVPKSSTKQDVHLKTVEGRTVSAKILASDTTPPKEQGVPLKTVEGRRGTDGPSANDPTPPTKKEVPNQPSVCVADMPSPTPCSLNRSSLSTFGGDINRRPSSLKTQLDSESLQNEEYSNLFDPQESNLYEIDSPEPVLRRHDPSSLSDVVVRGMPASTHVVKRSSSTFLPLRKEGFQMSETPSLIDRILGSQEEKRSPQKGTLSADLDDEYALPGCANDDLYATPGDRDPYAEPPSRNTLSPVSTCTSFNSFGIDSNATTSLPVTRSSEKTPLPVTRSSEKIPLPVTQSSEKPRDRRNLSPSSTPIPIQMPPILQNHSETVKSSPRFKEIPVPASVQEDEEDDIYVDTYTCSPPPIVPRKQAPCADEEANSSDPFTQNESTQSIPEEVQGEPTQESCQGSVDEESTLSPKEIALSTKKLRKREKFWNLFKTSKKAPAIVDDETKSETLDRAEDEYCDAAALDAPSCSGADAALDQEEVPLRIQEKIQNIFGTDWLKLMRTEIRRKARFLLELQRLMTGRRPQKREDPVSNATPPCDGEYDIDNLGASDPDPYDEEENCVTTTLSTSDEPPHKPNQEYVIADADDVIADDDDDDTYVDVHTANSLRVEDTGHTYLIMEEVKKKEEEVPVDITVEKSPQLPPKGDLPPNLPSRKKVPSLPTRKVSQSKSSVILTETDSGISEASVVRREPKHTDSFSRSSRKAIGIFADSMSKKTGLGRSPKQVSQLSDVYDDCEPNTTESVDSGKFTHEGSDSHNTFDSTESEDVKGRSLRPVLDQAPKIDKELEKAKKKYLKDAKKKFKINGQEVPLGVLAAKVSHLKSKDKFLVIREGEKLTVVKKTDVPDRVLVYNAFGEYGYAWMYELAGDLFLLDDNAEAADVYDELG